nr:MAG TPA: hypothetical protein [Caudoviricetes sp.]
MKTIFKKGMTVYDSLNFTKLKGEIVEIKESDDKTFSYPVVVKFDGVVNDKFYSEDGIIAGSLSKTLSTKPYEIKLEGFEQKQQEIDFDKMWKKPKKSYKPQIECYLSYPTQDLANAFEALRRLLFIMEYYNKGWQADWNNTQQIKYTIEYFQNQIWCDNYTTAKKILNFKSSEIRDKFLKEQKYLLEFAKPLI